MSERPRPTRHAELGRLLRQVREARGWTQEELAERIVPPLSPNTISNLERGRTRPYRHTLDALCDAFDLGEGERARVLDAWHAHAVPHAADPVLCAMEIEGAAGLWQSQPIAFSSDWACFEDLLRTSIAGVSGRIDRLNPADALCLGWLPSVQFATRWLVELRESLRRQVWRTGPRLRVRVAALEPLEEPDQLARTRALLAFAAGGGTVATASVARGLAATLSDALLIRELGAWPVTAGAADEPLFSVDFAEPSAAQATGTLEQVLQTAREAHRVEDFGTAFQHFQAADALGQVGPRDLELFGDAAVWQGDLQLAVAARQRAYDAYLARSDAPGAARVALALVVNYVTRLCPAVASGWYHRARRLLEASPPTPEHGWLAFTTVLFQIAMNDFEGAVETAARTFDLGRDYHDRDLQALGLVFQGFALLQLGRQAEGWPLLEEAMASAVAGELGPLARGLVYCRSLSMCLARLEYARALEWTRLIDASSTRSRTSAYSGDCATHRAAILLTQGAWADAEHEAQHACAAADTFDLTHAGIATYQVGEVRRRLGDLDAAEVAFRRAHELGTPPQPGLALILLAQGDATAAASALAHALAEVPIDQLARARLLPALVDATVALGDLAAAQTAAAELTEIAAQHQSDLLQAAAACTRGAVCLASADPTTAAAELRASLRGWRRVQAPYEAAQVQVLLAEALRRLGDRVAADLELDAARATFSRLGAQGDLARIEALA